ncbi:MAG TPA: lysyl oxidase family protein [Streptosporangiaceae bacterium]
MRSTQRNLLPSILVVAGLGAALLAPAAPASGAASTARTPGPVLKLEAAQSKITLDSFSGKVYPDAGIWLAAQGSPLQFDLRRAPYTSPITISQIIHPPFGGTIRRPLPSRLLDGWNGLRGFLTLTIRNSAGQVVKSEPVALCPNAYQPARVGPGAPQTSPYPPQCLSNPFVKGMVWGILKDWAIDPMDTDFRLGQIKLTLGRYRMTETVAPQYQKLFHISARDATATVQVKVVKGHRCCPVGGCCAPGPAARAHQTPPQPPASAVPYTTHPPRSALPDLVPLPAWKITVSHPSHQTHDYLNFAATVWVGGNSPLDVEGFRSHSSPVMPAYQYFWRNGHVIGRARAGTMGFDSKKGHDHWHFEQFARYTLLNKTKSVAVTSHKAGFCIAPSDEVDLLLPHAVWSPPQVGLQGECGSPTALWVAEEMPVGWGDTYIQSIAGQSFDITHVPNGTYYVEVTANPERVLYETSTRNDVSLRKVILGGTPGHRTVKVPAWKGIDPER